MHSVHLLSLVYVVFSLLSFSTAAPSYKKAAPKPPAPPEESVHPKEGDFVGIRVGKYEEKRASVKKTIMKTPHPAVIVGVPSTSNGGAYQVATISKNHPHNPPRAPIANFINNAGGIYGEIGLTAKTVPQEHLRSWKNPQTGEKQPPLDAENLKKLKKQMEPHKDWVPSRSPTPDSGEGSKHKPAQQAPATHTNPHASGSKSQIHPPSNPHANPHASSSKSQIHHPSNPNSGIAGDSKIKHPVVQVSRPGPSFSGSSHGTYVPQSPAKHIGPQAQSHLGGASGSGSSSIFSHRPPVNPWRHPQQSPAHVGNVHPSSQSRWPPSTSSHPQRHPQAAPVNQPHHGGRTPPPAHANQKPQHDPAHHRPSQPGGHRPKSPQPWRRPPSRSGSPRPKVSSSSRPPSPHRVWGSRPKVPGHPEPPRKGPSNNHHPAKEKRNVGFRR